jgi:hypothetical protein
MAAQALAEEKLGVPVYAKAQFEEAETKQRNDNFKQWNIESEIAIYSTADPFDKVYEFYTGHYKKKPEVIKGSDVAIGAADNSRRAEFILDKKAKFASKAKHLLVIEQIIYEDEPGGKTQITITKSK